MKFKIPGFNREVEFHRGALREPLANAGVGPQVNPTRQRSLLERLSPVLIRRTAQLPVANQNPIPPGANLGNTQQPAATLAPLTLGGMGDALTADSVFPSKAPEPEASGSTSSSTAPITLAEYRRNPDTLTDWKPRPINLPPVDRELANAKYRGKDKEAGPADRLVDAAALRLAQLPKSLEFANEEHKAEGLQLLFSLLDARSEMLPGSRARADMLLRPHLELLIDTADESMSKARKDELIDSALSTFTSPSVSIDQSAAAVNALMLKRELFAQQIRFSGDDGRAPEVLRRHAGPLLNTYRLELERLKAANKRPELPEWDNLVLPLLIEAQNAKTSGLEAKLLNQQQLIQLVSQAGQSAGQCIGIYDFGVDHFAGSGHLAAVLVNTSPDRPPRITVLDSFSEEPSMGMMGLFNKLPAGTQVVPVFLRTQMAEECVICSLAMTKKIADHRAAVDNLHTKGTSFNWGPTAVFQTIFGPDVLPPAFFKQSQQKSTLDKLKAAGIRDGNYDADTDAVNKKGKTIFQRWTDHAVTRPHERRPSEMATYSASIERKRTVFIDHASGHFRAN